MFVVVKWEWEEEYEQILAIIGPFPDQNSAYEYAKQKNSPPERRGSLRVCYVVESVEKP